MARLLQSFRRIPSRLLEVKINFIHLRLDSTVRLGRLQALMPPFSHSRSITSSSCNIPPNLGLEFALQKKKTSDVYICIVPYAVVTFGIDLGWEVLTSGMDPSSPSDQAEEGAAVNRRWRRWMVW